MHRLMLISWRVSGQSLPLVALFAVVIFAMMGFAIDAGLLYTQRRLMQNTSDAACLAAANRLSLNQSTSQATTAAEQIVQTNLGATPGAGVNAPGTLAYSSVNEIYSPLAGTGADLTKGIEISGADVRVALRSPANAFFLRIVGYDTYTVAARSHCNAKAGGGGVPFAVTRWRGYDTSGDVNTDGLTTNKALPQDYKQGSTNKPMTVRDMLGEEAQSIICQPPATSPATCAGWPGWGAADYPGDPTSGTGLYSDATHPASDPDLGGAWGPETVIAGSGATPNVGDSSFSGPIVLDFRQTTFPSPLFYNGLQPTTALNQYKDYATRYILGSYPGPFVIPGQEIAYYNGISAGQIQKPFDQRYDVGDKITVLMYNGTINSDPDFSVTFPASTDDTASRAAGTFTLGSLTCSVPSGEAFDGKALSQTDRKADAAYKINVLPQSYSTFKLRAFISSSEPGKWEGSWNSGSYRSFNINGAAPVVSISTSGLDLPFQMRPTNTFDCTDPLLGTVTTYPSRKNGAETIYLESQDTATGKRRAVYVLLNQDANSNDFYAYFSQIPMVYQPLEPGNSTSAELKLDKVSGSNLDIGAGASKVQVGTIQWFDAGDVNSPIASGTALNGVTVDVSKSGSKNKLTINASNTATTGKEYYIRIPLTYGSYTHYAWYYISVRTPLSSASGIGQYVYALGYATFEITYIDSNTIKGRAISGLKRTPSELISGFQPRLTTWE